MLLIFVSTDVLFIEGHDASLLASGIMMHSQIACNGGAVPVFLNAEKLKSLHLPLFQKEIQKALTGTK